MTTLIELWKEIPGFAHYEASTLGNIRSRLPGRAVRQLKAGRTPNGYLMVGVHGKSRLIHRLVGITFLAPVNGKTQINHKNGIKTDNTLTNLEWSTQSENVRHCFRVLGRVNPIKGVVGVNHKSHKAYIGTSLDGTHTIYFPSGHDARAKGFSSSGMADCIYGRTRQHKGYVWKHADAKQE